MTNDQLASLRNIGASLKHVGAAIAECINHARAGSATPLQPLDECLGAELQNLRREGQEALADALAALRSEVGAIDNE